MYSLTVSNLPYVAITLAFLSSFFEVYGGDKATIFSHFRLTRTNVTVYSTEPDENLFRSR